MHSEINLDPNERTIDWSSLGIANVNVYVLTLTATIVGYSPNSYTYSPISLHIE